LVTGAGCCLVEPDEYQEMHSVALYMRLLYIASATLLHVGDLEPPVDSMQVGYHAPMSMYSSCIGSGVVDVPDKYR
jgi:hypothetical protein